MSSNYLDSIDRRVLAAGCCHRGHSPRKGTETMYRALPRIVCGALAIAAAGCTTSASSATDLHPEGPPMIEQVRLTELAILPGVSTPFDRTVFAFGTHPEASESEVHHV